MLAFLQQREQLWTRNWVEAEAGGAGNAGGAATGDLRPLPRVVQKDDFEGCSFINILLEMNDRETAIGKPAPTT